MNRLRRVGAPAMAALRRALARGDRVLTTGMRQLGRERRIDVYEHYYTNDYIRLSTFELVTHEIESRKVPGAAAEVGVYQGDFARKINAALPDRPLYLFDTFTGFAPEEEQRDREQHGLSYQRDFSDTSAARVLRRMPHPDRCIVRTGLFPETAKGLEEERFCFVSLDTDLYDPLLSGLEFFYPRLSPGGFIFVHDYNNSNFPGARKAVHDFSAAHSVPYVPMTDMFGTAIFAKA